MEGARYLEDGKLTVFRRAGIYYARIRISPVKYIWRSLKTSNEQTAVEADILTLRNDVRFTTDSVAKVENCRAQDFSRKH